VLRRSFPFVAAVASLVGCARPTPPGPPQPRSATTVGASFGKTWDAVIDVFAERNISIATLDRASGLIVPAEALYTTRDTSSLRWADCGQTMMRTPLLPHRARFNVVVRGDSAASSVQVRAFFYLDPASAMATALGFECVSRGTFESDVEADVRARAEGRAAPATARVGTRDPACASNDGARVGGHDIVAEVSVPSDTGCVARRCVYLDVARSMSPETAIARCRSEARKP
jgi:hypothetical protein